LSADVSDIPTSCLGDTTKDPSTTRTVPPTKQFTPEPMSSANTFLDSVLNLCRKSLISCGDSDDGLIGGELMFIDLVKLLGLIQAKHWADALHIPNQKSYALLAHVLYGSQLPKHDPLASFTESFSRSTRPAAPETILADCQNTQGSGPKESHQPLPESRTSLSESESSRGRWRTFLGKIHYAVFRATCRTILGFDLRVWYGILLELRSLPGNIEILRARKLHLSGIVLGPGKEPGPNGRLVPCKRTLTRIQDMQYLLSIHPQASRVEMYLFLEGWAKGEQWAHSQSASVPAPDSCNKQRAENT
jgi:hypothetical protein